MDHNKIPREIQRYYEDHIGFGGEELIIAVISFIFGSIGEGFFSEIGKDLWGKTKKKAYDMLTTGEGDKKPDFVLLQLLFEYRDKKIKFSFKHDLKKELKPEDVSDFLEGSRSRIVLLKQRIDAKSEEIGSRQNLELEYRAEEGDWILK